MPYTTQCVKVRCNKCKHEQNITFQFHKNPDGFGGHTETWVQHVSICEKCEVKLEATGHGKNKKEPNYTDIERITNLKPVKPKRAKEIIPAPFFDVNDDSVFTITPNSGK